MSVAAFIADQKTGHGVPHAIACRALGVSQSWFHKWKKRIGAHAPTRWERRQAERRKGRIPGSDMTHPNLGHCCPEGHSRRC